MSVPALRPTRAGACAEPAGRISSHAWLGASASAKASGAPFGASSIFGPAWGSAVQASCSQTRTRIPTAEAPPAKRRAGGRLFSVGRDGATGFPVGDGIRTGAAVAKRPRFEAAGVSSPPTATVTEATAAARSATAATDRMIVRRLTQTRIPAAGRLAGRLYSSIPLAMRKPRARSASGKRPTSFQK